MAELPKLDEQMDAFKRQMIHLAIADLDTRSFFLYQRVRRLERKWPGATPELQRLYRRRRMRLWADLEILKIDLDALERRAKPFFDKAT